MQRLGEFDEARVLGVVVNTPNQPLFKLHDAEISRSETYLGRCILS